MKIKQEHFQAMKSAMTPLAGKIEDHRKYIIKEGKAKDVEMRLRWDLLHASLGSRWICDNLYPYVHDNHIDTALKQIVKELSETKT